jgi:hypothetical protein
MRTRDLSKKGSEKRQREYAERTAGKRHGEEIASGRVKGIPTRTRSERRARRFGDQGRFHSLAERELIESARFYGARASGLGGDFSATVRSGETAWKRRKIFRYAATCAKRSFLPRLRRLWAARASGCGRL